MPICNFGQKLALFCQKFEGLSRFDRIQASAL